MSDVWPGEEHEAANGSGRPFGYLRCGKAVATKVFREMDTAAVWLPPIASRQAVHFAWGRCSWGSWETKYAKAAS